LDGGGGGGNGGGGGGDDDDLIDRYLGTHQNTITLHPCYQLTMVTS